MYVKLSLDGDSWILKQKSLPSELHSQKSIKSNFQLPNKFIECKAQVPGEVHTDLIREGVIEDPYISYNELKYRWIALCDWEYSTSFFVPLFLKEYARIVLVCEGLDTIASIELNGVHVGYSENMFRQYEFNLLPSIKFGEENHLNITFTSPGAWAEKKALESPYVIPLWEYPHGIHHRNHIRKTGCSFGWDWGPAFSPMGIYKSIHLIAHNNPIITSVITNQEHIGEGEVVLHSSISIFSTSSSVVILVAQVKEKESSEIIGEIKFSSDLKANQENTILAPKLQVTPHLWWPAGFGKQHLYNFEVKIIENDPNQENSSHKLTFNSPIHTTLIGFRDVILDRTKDDEGESFKFVVNGVPIFSKGADWIPTDSFLTRLTKSHYFTLLQSAKDANMNMLRVWGGGIYEHDHFYEICDELGILLWHDFMFACALYPATDEFLKNVEHEIICQVRRIGNHPCVALWCGNNENEEAMAVFPESKANRDPYLIDYYKLFQVLIPKVLSQEIPKISENTKESFYYWPSSPSNGLGVYGNPQDVTRGDTHCWAVWHSNKPFSEYLKIKSRFCSEFGFQSLCSEASFKKVLLEDDWNLMSPQLDYRQRSPTPGNKGLLEHVANHFRVPSGFSHFIFMTQVLQAVSIKTGVEHWRRMSPYCKGTLYWQLNDIWQGPSWSSLEFNGSWKILHHFAEKFYSPVLASIVETLTMPSNIEVWLTSDLVNEIKGVLTVELWLYQNSSPIFSLKENINLPRISSSKYWSTNVEEFLVLFKANRETSFLVCKWETENNNNEPFYNFHFFSPLKRVYLLKPKISLEFEETKEKNNKEDSIRFKVKTDSLALFVYLSVTNENFHGRFSDNGFHMLPYTEKIVHYFVWPNEYPASHSNSSSLDIDLLKSSIKVISYRDTY